MLVRCRCMACRPATSGNPPKQPIAIVMDTQARQSFIVSGQVATGLAPTVLCDPEGTYMLLAAAALWALTSRARCSSAAHPRQAGGFAGSASVSSFPIVRMPCCRPSSLPIIRMPCRERAAAGARGAEDLAGHGRRCHLRNLCSVRRLGSDSAAVRRTSQCTTALGQRCSPLLQDKMVPLLSVVVTLSAQIKS